MRRLCLPAETQGGRGLRNDIHRPGSAGTGRDHPSSELSLDGDAVWSELMSCVVGRGGWKGEGVQV